MPVRVLLHPSEGAEFWKKVNRGSVFECLKRCNPVCAGASEFPPFTPDPLDRYDVGVKEQKSCNFAAEDGGFRRNGESEPPRELNRAKHPEGVVGERV